MTVHYTEAHGFEPIRQILDRVLQSGRMRRKFTTAEVWAVWEQAVGAAVAAHAKPGPLEEGVLTVYVDSPVWHHQLTALEAKVVDQVNAQLSEKRVRKVRFSTKHM